MFHIEQNFQFTQMTIKRTTISQLTGTQVVHFELLLVVFIIILVCVFIPRYSDINEDQAEDDDDSDFDSDEWSGDSEDETPTAVAAQSEGYAAQTQPVVSCL